MVADRHFVCIFRCARTTPGVTKKPLVTIDRSPRSAPAPAALPESFSVYLDLIRWAAASLVMLYHLRENGFGSHWINAHLPGNGHAYVTIFFVLSGFVISYTNDRKRHLGAREYVTDRATRIYSVAIPVLVLCFLASLAVEPRELRDDYRFSLDHPGLSALVNLLFLGNVWFLGLSPYLDGPYWSLSYEVIYYVAFGLWVFSRRRWLWMLVVACVAGPKILLLFPCWLIGVALDRWRDRWRPTRGQAIGIAMAGLATPALAYALGLFSAAKHLSTWLLGSHYSAYSTSVNFTSDYVTAVAFAIHLLGVYWWRPALPAWLAAFARWGASIAFSLYLFHMPVLQISKRWLGDSVATNTALIAAIVVIVFACYLLALVTERKREALKRLFRGLPKPLLSRTVE
jgi:peptidoglycan/LPS O-acetylase OafA/YrhL